MKDEGSLRFSHEVVTVPYSEPAESNSHPITLDPS